MLGSAFGVPFETVSNHKFTELWKTELLFCYVGTVGHFVILVDKVESVFSKFLKLTCFYHFNSYFKTKFQPLLYIHLTVTNQHVVKYNKTNARVRRYSFACENQTFLCCHLLHSAHEPLGGTMSAVCRRRSMRRFTSL